MTQRAKLEGAKLDRTGLLHLLVVYIVWGSTYLAIRVAVQAGAGFPPFTMAMMRVVVAAAILLGWSRLRRERIRLDRSEFVLLLFRGRCDTRDDAFSCLQRVRTPIARSTESDQGPKGRVRDPSQRSRIDLIRCTALAVQRRRVPRARHADPVWRWLCGRVGHVH